MRITSDLFNGVGGKIGELVGLMNKSGMCLRRLVIPANPKTAYQRGVRDTLYELATAWSQELSVDERAGWAAYAATLTFTSKLGTDYTISGFGAYCGANAARMVAGLSRVDTPPTTGGFATMTPPTVTFVAATDKVSVAFTDTDAWAGEVGGAMTVRLCPLGMSAGITFYEGPFRFLDSIDGAVSPPSSPALLDAGYDIVADVQYAVAIRVVRADGRYSPESIFRGLGA
jgi:hypothetical protein